MKSVFTVAAKEFSDGLRRDIIHPINGEWTQTVNDVIERLVDEFH